MSWVPPRGNLLCYHTNPIPFYSLFCFQEWYCGIAIVRAWVQSKVSTTFYPQKTAHIACYGIRTKSPWTKPPGQNPPDKIPLDKIPLGQNLPRTKSLWTKSPLYILYLLTVLYFNNSSKWVSKDREFRSCEHTHFDHLLRSATLHHFITITSDKILLDKIPPVYFIILLTAIYFINISKWVSG